MSLSSDVTFSFASSLRSPALSASFDPAPVSFSAANGIAASTAPARAIPAGLLSGASPFVTRFAAFLAPLVTFSRSAIFSLPKLRGDSRRGQFSSCLSIVSIDRVGRLLDLRRDPTDAIAPVRDLARGVADGLHHRCWIWHLGSAELRELHVWPLQAACSLRLRKCCWRSTRRK